MITYLEPLRVTNELPGLPANCQLFYSSFYFCDLYFPLFLYLPELRRSWRDLSLPFKLSFEHQGGADSNFRQPSINCFIFGNRFVFPFFEPFHLEYVCKLSYEWLQLTLIQNTPTRMPRLHVQEDLQNSKLMIGTQKNFIAVSTVVIVWT